MNSLSKLAFSGITALTLSVAVAGCGNGGVANESSKGVSEQQTNYVTVSSGTLTVQVPNGWELIDKSETDVITGPWVVGARDSNKEPTVQIRLSTNTGETPHADSTNAAVLMGNTLAQAGNVNPGATEKAEVKGADEANIAHFEYQEGSSDVWIGFFLSAANRDTGNVATMELITSKDHGISQDEIASIIDSAVYDKSKEK